MVSSVLIIVVSVALFAYWFRYTCALLLESKPAQDYAAGIAAENGLSFVQVHRQIEALEATDWDTVHSSIERDYRVVAKLLKRTMAVPMAGASFEEILLRADFWLMRVCYHASRRMSESKARAALHEMCQIIDHHANTVGERLATVPAGR